MFKSYVGRICPFCVTSIQEGAEVLICSVCSKPHHSDCWMYNLNRCTTFGCKGTAQHPEFIIDTLEPEVTIKTDLLKPSNFRPSLYNNPRKLINNSEKRILQSGPRPVALNPMNLPGKKLIKPINSKTNLLTDKKKPKGLNSLARPQRKNPGLNNNAPIPKPAPYIPDYVNKEFIKKEWEPVPKPVYKPIIFPDFMTGKKKEQVSPARPDAFVPDYVNSKLKPMHGWNKTGNGIKRPAGPKPIFNFSKIPEKPEEQINKNDGSVSKPDPFIPDFVNGVLPATSRRRMAKLFKQPPIKLPEIILNQKEYIDSIPRPEPFIPEYVNAELPKLSRSLFPENIFSNVKCPHCDKSITAYTGHCPYCNGLLGNNSPSNVMSENYSKIKPEIIVYSDSGIEFKTLFVNAKQLKSVCFSPDGRYISFGSSDTSVKIWDIFSKKCIKNFNEHINAVTSVCFSPDGLFIASGSSDKTVKIWDLNADKCIKTMTGNPMGVEALVYSKDGNFVISGAGYGTIKVWNINTKICMTTAETSTPSWLNCLSYCPIGPFVASCNAEPMINIWDIRDGTCLKYFKGHLDFVNSVAYSPDGLYLASGSNDRTVKLWNIELEKCILTISGHEETVNSVAYSPDGRFIASGSNDKTIKIWDVNSGTCMKVITGHSSKINSVVYSPDGCFIASSSDDKSIRIWQLF